VSSASSGVHEYASSLTPCRRALWRTQSGITLFLTANWYELQAAKDSDFIFVFVHEPLYPTLAIHASLDRNPGDRDRLADMLGKYKEKLVVFCGHEHCYIKKSINGLTQIVSGGAGAPLYAPPANGGFYHYIHVTVRDKQLHMALIKLGAVFSLDSTRNIPVPSEKQAEDVRPPLLKNPPIPYSSSTVCSAIPTHSWGWNATMSMTVVRTYRTVTG